MNERNHFERLLRANFGPVGELSAPQVERLWAHYELLGRWNRVLNLTSIRTLEEAIRRHYCESLFMGLHLPPEPVSVLDIGSGAGFPGVPVGILRPDCRVALAESHRRKAVFLREATRNLGNVSVCAQRAETVEGPFDWVVARAVRWRQVLPLATRLGRVVALLLGRADVAAVQSASGIRWRDPIPVPWSTQGFLLIGSGCSTWNIPAKEAHF